MIMNIYVGNLPYTVTEEQLRAAFADFGEVTSANVIMDRMSGQSKGFGFVEMPNNSEAEEAINALNESAFNGRNIKVNQARPRNDRGGGGGGGGGGRSRY
jgi:RNA recognition motif-containing protein